MKWQDAVRFSQLGVATRDCSANWKEPARVHVWISKKRTRRHVMVRSGRWERGSRRFGNTALSTKRASRFDDWVPVKPHPPMMLLAIAAQLEDEAT